MPRAAAIVVLDLGRAGALRPGVMDLPLVFLQGPWRLAMGLNALDPADWLCFDEEWGREIGLKRSLLAERQGDVHALLPEGEAAAQELLELLFEHLPRYHPDRFTAADGGLHVIEEDRRVALADADPLKQAGLLVQEDLCLLAPDQEGSYRLVGASLCFPMRWRLAEKLGQPMAAIHTPVPGFAERLGRPVDRYFSALDPARPVWRANWSVTDDPELFQPHGRTKAIAIRREEVGQRLWLRVERQTLRRLPRTRLVLFTIRTFVRRLERIAADPALATALAARIAEMPDAMLRYKNMLDIREPLTAWLAEVAAVDAQEPAASLG
jgi:dimethylamine monooxygenase subunit A